MQSCLRVAAIAGSAFVGSLFSPHRVDACSCISYPNETVEQVRHRVETAFDTAAAVFSGEVVSGDDLAVVIRVASVWKGSIGPEVRMRRKTQRFGRVMVDHGCEYHFERGGEYLVFASRLSPEVMSASQCGFTAPIERAGGTIKTLDLLRSIPQGGEPDACARFLALERSWMNALAARDIPALEALLAPEFTIIGAGSDAGAPVGDRSDWLRNAARFPWPKHDVRLVKVHDRGDVVIVHAVLRATYPPKSITPEGGDIQFLVTDTWIRQPSAWQVLSRHSSVIAK